jgi:chemotaxis protein MotB
MKRLALPLLILASLAGCVSTGKYKAEQSAAASQKQRADDLAAQFEALKSSDTAVQQDLSARLKATADSLASAQVSNADLQQSLAANKSTLSQKVAELIKDRDVLAQKFNDQAAQIASLQTKSADADTARAAAEAAKAAELEKAKKSYEDLQAGLKSEIAAGEIKITQLQGKLTVNLVDRILFDSGKAEIKDDGRKVLDKVGGVLNTVKDKNIRIEGHTDNKPITGDLLSKYPSNWELSTARATAVARYLQDKDKVDPSRLVAAGYGEFRPVASNDTVESRALNRRIEIVLVPRD